MDWKEYEIYITRHFQKLFPDTPIQRDVRREGIISKTKRKIDILIEGRVAGFDLKVIVDCKYFNKKVNVKEVESFLSFLQDLRARGFTPISRTHLKRPIMGQEVCHGKTEEVHRGVQTRSGGAGQRCRCDPELDRSGTGHQRGHAGSWSYTHAELSKDSPGLLEEGADAVELLYGYTHIGNVLTRIGLRAGGGCSV